MGLTKRGKKIRQVRNNGVTPHFLPRRETTWHMQAVKLSSFYRVPENYDVGAVHAFQIKKSRKRIYRVEPVPLWASSYTKYALYKAQDPLSACRQSNCS